MTSETRSVAVLLSAFNGEKYIEEQIQSILNQQSVEISLIVRDDGSQDATPEILARLAIEHTNISIINGDNIGVIQSFFELTRLAPNRSDYYAFADQDDIWNADKLSHAISTLAQHNPEGLLLYCSAIEYVDQDLRHLRMSDQFSPDRIGFKNALVQNIATGCTIVLNRSARSKIIEKLPNNCVMHDWWMYLVVSAFGTVLYDDRSGLKYRQHHQNVLGVALSFRNRMKRRLDRLRNAESMKISTQIQEFYRLFSTELSLEKQRQVERILQCNRNFFSRLRLIASNDFQRQNAIDDALIRLLVLIGKF